MSKSAKQREEELKRNAMQAGLIALGGGFLGVGRNVSPYIVRALERNGKNTAALVAKAGLSSPRLGKVGTVTLAEGEKLSDRAMEEDHVLDLNNMAKGPDFGEKLAFIMRQPEPHMAWNPMKEIDYGVVHVPAGKSGTYQFNALLHTGGEYDEALQLQTPDEHQAMLAKYMDDPKRDFEQAKQMGEATEAACPKLWGTDKKLRRPVTPSSSVAKGIKVVGNTVKVEFGSNPGKWYTYDGGPNLESAVQRAAELVTSPSIGRALNCFGKGDWREKYSYNRGRRPPYKY